MFSIQKRNKVSLKFAQLQPFVPTVRHVIPAEGLQSGQRTCARSLSRRGYELLRLHLEFAQVFRTARQQGSADRVAVGFDILRLPLLSPSFTLLAASNPPEKFSKWNRCRPRLSECN